MSSFFYFQKLPREAFSQGIFFLNPLKDVPSDSSAPWYSACQTVGKNTLDMKLRRMCSLAGINGDFSNHSLRATSAT